MIMAMFIVLSGFVMLNVYNFNATVKSLEKDLKKMNWLHLPKEEYLKKTYEFVAHRFGKVNRCWLKYPWRNVFSNNLWKSNGLDI